MKVTDWNSDSDPVADLKRGVEQCGPNPDRRGPRVEVVGPNEYARRVKRGEIMRNYQGCKNFEPKPETAREPSCWGCYYKNIKIIGMKAEQDRDAEISAERIAEYEAQHEADLTLQVEQAARIVELERQNEMLRENVADQRGMCVRLYSKLSAAREALND